ncbi:unnamed protein product, partial [Polarella glacialis]
VIAFESRACESFAIRVNGELLLPPLPVSELDANHSPWPKQVELAEGTVEFPWDAREVVYIDGAWNFLHAGHQGILKQARARGCHLLVGVHSDETLREVFGGKCHESFETRFGRILQNRHVSSALKDAPWTLTADLLASLRIQKVVTGSVSKLKDGGGK